MRKYTIEEVSKILGCNYEGTLKTYECLTKLYEKKNTEVKDDLITSYCLCRIAFFSLFLSLDIPYGLVYSIITRLDCILEEHYAEFKSLFDIPQEDEFDYLILISAKYNASILFKRSNSDNTAGVMVRIDNGESENTKNALRDETASTCNLTLLKKALDFSAIERIPR